MPHTKMRLAVPLVGTSRSTTAQHWPAIRRSLTFRAGHVELDTSAHSHASSTPPRVDSESERRMDELAAYNAQAMQLREQGRLLEAIRLLERALPELRQTLGGHHDITLAAMSNLGALLIEAKMFAEAEPYCREVVQRRRGALGDNDQSTIRSMTNLASLLQAQGKIDAAVEQWREVVTAQRQGLGSRHEGTLTAIGNLAVTLLEQSKEELEEPVALLTEELRVRVATLGKGCLKSLPQLTGSLLRRLYDALFAQPNLGADVEGYELLMGYVKAAMGGE